MNDKLVKAQDAFLDRVNQLCNKFGLNNIMGQLYTILYLSNKPLSLDEMAEKIKVSKGSISVNIRELEKWGAVKPVWVKGSRKDYYEANLDIKKIIADRIKSGVQKRISEVDEMLDEFKKVVGSANGSLTEEERRVAKVYQDRVKKIEELKTMASSALELAAKFL